MTDVEDMSTGTESLEREEIVGVRGGGRRRGWGTRQRWGRGGGRGRGRGGGVAEVGGRGWGRGWETRHLILNIY